MSEAFLEHYGVKGMKWGVSRVKQANAALKAPTEIKTFKKPGDFVKSTGGRNQQASEDAVKAQVYRQKAKSSTTDSLSNKELQDLVQRMNLEQQYNNLSTQQDRRSKGRKLVHRLLVTPVPGKEEVTGKTVVLSVTEMYSPATAKVAGVMLNQVQAKTAPPKDKKK